MNTPHTSAPRKLTRLLLAPLGLAVLLAAAPTARAQYPTQRQRAIYQQRLLRQALLAQQLRQYQQALLRQRQLQAALQSPVVRRRLATLLGPAANDPRVVANLFRQQPGLFTASGQLTLGGPWLSPQTATLLKQAQTVGAAGANLVNQLAPLTGTAPAVANPYHAQFDQDAVLQSLKGW